jgi:ArsR family transcriptional regulator, arsenate/arsenite/antimonite-responsive transcriptional repressor
MNKKNYKLDTLFKALADHTRLRLIGLMGDSEVCVCFFVVILKLSQPKISRHLAYLRRAGIVTARREGKWMHYRLIDPPDAHASRIFREVRTSLTEHPVFQKDRQRLTQLCCAGTLPVQLRHAPRPAGARS